MTEQEMIQKIYEVIKLVDCMQYNPSVDFNYLRAKGAYNIIKNQVEHIEAENAELRARLDKAVELPVKVGDTVYFIPTYNGKPIWGVQRGIVQMVGITRQGYHVKIRDRADFNKTYMFRKSAFLSKEQAEACLAKLKGEEKNG